MGWAAALAAAGPDALAQEDIVLPGRFYHFAGEEVRLREVRAVLQEYKELFAAAAGVAPPVATAAPAELPAEEAKQEGALM